ncbi:glycosyltransferase family 2 protein [Brachyspira pilosicoli]|uniref:glycosyltransferase family 2 protein n=1 Tax=Brachyspira pilosicoli TaxID=52584 RepID=UPI0018DF5439|nr:glycosyltransferase family 2 protein [Brachyspira pilosicoli]
MIKVSVIVPVYNVEIYLRECLNSIINQTLKEIEIICIDDCSSDNSYNILEEYAKKDNRVKIFKNTQNESVGYNRNLGLKEARGEYISFIDSDDFISEDFLYNLYNTAKKYDSDMVNTLNIKFYKNQKITKFYYTFYDKEFESTWNLNDIENSFSKQAIAPYVWNKIYRTSFLVNNNLNFMTTKFGASEDTNFLVKLMLHKPKISFNNNSIYYYRYSPVSLTNIVKTNIQCFSNNILNMTDALNYCKVYYPEFLDDIYLKVFVPTLNFYFASSQKTKRELYQKIYDFVQELNIDKSKINKKSSFENDVFNEYLSIKISKTYDEYLFNSHLLNRVKYIEKEVYSSNNWFRLFGINNTKEYLTIILFGIKISIKKT